MTATDTSVRRVPLPSQIAGPGIVAIGRGLDPARVPEFGAALADGGVRAFEITMNSSDALGAIAALAARFAGDELLVGAGTVLDVPAAEAATGAGARFLVMPHLDRELVEWAAQRDIPVFPGCATPTEAFHAWRWGATAVKLFPASVTGPAFIRELHGPLPEIPVIPTGGISVDNAASFITAGAAAIGLGSWLTASGDPGTIRERAERIVAAVADAR